ncbi:hypothetical protein DSM106972_007250 [Dulcicalothrix desertica PCC 7102]|uniref:DUF4112 domain-containing protein n=1 Tax=Dulcicalothrix desertica PCC 7102 TaxID=232991 RepID=A0A433VVX3_9CYAN|nr:DUF4112 domain-containing protein [Dulcicalothrix desertica]RUT10230.1 hypothetical protein DSM106972_007250 [Dulcicalothrix desertica PCC 7102]TWH40794.1 uncharacterized protein DUF4112 [Dulcicalothrix desertica PCC 7102]
MHDTNAKLAKLQSLRKLSDLWDRSLSVPGTKFKVGLESLVGLLPVGGDFIGILMSVYIVFQAIQFKLPKTVLAKMIFNIVIDGAVGSIPILGDIFDTTWKANTKNVNLLEAHLREPIKSRQKDKWFINIVLAVLVLILIGIIALFAFGIWLAVRFLGGNQ